MTDRLVDKPDRADEADAEEQAPIRCAACGQELASPQDVCSIGGEPPLRVQVNPHGVAFQVVTLARAHGLDLVGLPETEATWFAGYTWTIAVCGDCGTHLGWRFDAVTGRLPGRFWGLVAGRLAGL